MYINIVSANKSMCGELARIKRQVWETTYKGIYPDEKFDNFDITKQAKKFLKIINSQNTYMFVAILDNKIIGYTAIGKAPRRPNAENEEIVLLYVLKEFQGFGVGKALFNFGKDKLKTMCDNFIVYCNKYNKKALDFYLKMGCKIVEMDEDHDDKSLPQVKLIYNF